MPLSMTLAVAFASVLGGAAVGLTEASAAARLAASVLAAGTLGAAVAVLKGRRSLVPAVIVLGLGVVTLLAAHLYRVSFPVPLRSLHVAATLSWGAVLLASLVRLIRLTDWNRALLAAFSLAIPLSIADALVPPPPSAQMTPWRVTTQPDPDTGFRYVPNSTAQNFYPDNPRGYFEQTIPSRANWSIETHAGSEATLEFASAGQGDVIRITIPKLPERQPWHVKLQQAPLTISSGTSYMVSFNARADSLRPVSCAVGQNHEPWELIGTYHEFEVGTAWRRFECPFVATSSDSQARLFFDLAKSDAPVELQSIVIADQSTGRPVTPPVKPPEFVVNYRFNSLGLRGPDRAIPAPPGTFRIVVLGDSYALGVGVKEEDTVEAQLEAILNAGARARGDTTVYEVINDGVSGYDTRQERMSFEKHSSKYGPQLVVLLMVFNDDLSYNDALRRGALTSSSGASSLFNLLGRAESIRERHQYDYSGSLYEVRQLHEAARQRGAQLAVAIFRNTDSEPWLKLVETATASLKGTGIPLLDLGSVLVTGQIGQRDLAVHEIDGHPNEIAHRLAAEELERFLREQRMLP